MRTYDFTAVSDIREIIRYTFREWGEAQARRYQQALTDTLESIARGEVAIRAFSDNLPDVFVTQHQHHYIFYVSRNLPRPLIVAVLHKRQEKVARLADRLD